MKGVPEKKDCKKETEDGHDNLEGVVIKAQTENGKEDTRAEGQYAQENAVNFVSAESWQCARVQAA
ncbi:MAG: hypothetical protein JSS69_14045 [Acidobacteria bacterium]|nr:hypothetical protein [Acidobacteriota bacterium]MBS1867032.1 hypothetical protein [Acidobacteriota bacterium]